ncbi:MAG: hypothetical protein BZ135_01750 [Methanosphaera sp. rholeuAM6]|nr:MAG: hypothetical protein BZ135_01750 [Methanosphaera sp. rholeuAM6]
MVLNRHLRSIHNIKYHKRDDFYNLKLRMDNFIEKKSDKRFFIMPGLRGVGKTTLLFQCYEYLIKQKDIPISDILYLSCDFINSISPTNIREIIETYLKTVHNTTPRLLNKPVFVFLDEVHYDKTWALNAKIIYDQSPNIFMIFTGSSSLHLNYNADTARRVVTYPILPLNYSQHLKLKYGYTSNISDNLINLIFKDEIESAQEKEEKINEDLINLQDYVESDWDDYFRYGSFCSTLNEIYKEDIISSLWSTISKIITNDIASVYNLNRISQENVYRVLLLLASQKPGQISQNKVASSLGKSTSTINHIFEILEKTQLLFHYQAYGGSNKKARKSWKYYIATASLKNSINEKFGNTSINQHDYNGILLENMIASTLFNLNQSQKIPRFNTYYDSSNGGVDFIIQKEFETAIPIEVGLGKKNNKQIKKAMNKFGSNHGILISNRTKKIEEKNGIVYITPKTFSFI